MTTLLYRDSALRRLRYLRPGESDINYSHYSRLRVGDRVEIFSNKWEEVTDEDMLCEIITAIEKPVKQRIIIYQP